MKRPRFEIEHLRRWDWEEAWEARAKRSEILASTADIDRRWALELVAIKILLSAVLMDLGDRTTRLWGLRVWFGRKAEGVSGRNWEITAELLKKNIVCVLFGRHACKIGYLSSINFDDPRPQVPRLFVKPLFSLNHDFTYYSQNWITQSILNYFILSNHSASSLVFLLQLAKLKAAPGRYSSKAN